MGVQNHNWWRWVTGETVPRGKNLTRLAEELGTTAEYLVTGADPRTQPAPSYPAWDEFVRLEFESQADPPPDHFRVTLASVRFYGCAPTVRCYQAMLLALQGHSKPLGK
jgi:hypothetical protein